MSAGFRRLAWLTVNAAMSAAVTAARSASPVMPRPANSTRANRTITAHRHRRQPALAGQVGGELRQQRLSRRRGPGVYLRDHAQAPQVAQQRDKGPPAGPGPVPRRPAGLQVAADHLLVSEPASWPAASIHPLRCATSCACASTECRAKPTRGQLPAPALRIRRQRPADLDPEWMASALTAPHDCLLDHDRRGNSDYEDTRRHYM